MSKNFVLNPGLTTGELGWRFGTTWFLWSVIRGQILIQVLSDFRAVLHVCCSDTQHDWEISDQSWKSFFPAKKKGDGLHVADLEKGSMPVGGLMWTLLPWSRLEKVVLE